MPTQSQEAIPFSEPAWTTSLYPSPYYKESHFKLRNYVRTYLQDEIYPYAQEWEQAGEIPSAAYGKHAEMGLILPGLPAKYRGGRQLPCGIKDEEWDWFHSLVIAEESHRQDMGVMWGLTGGSGIGCPPILNFGTEEQRSKYLPAVHKGEIRFCLGITEPSAGSDVAGIRTTARLNSSGTHYIVSGQKKWITNAMWADYATTAVRTGGQSASGISVLIIPLKNTKGVTVRRMHNSGINASGSTFLEFDDVLVPKENLIGRENEGFKVIMSNFNPERLSLAYGALRLARTCYSEAFAHALRRKTFGKALMENQIIRAKFAGMARNVESCYAWLEQLAWQIQNSPTGANDEMIGARIALAKVQAGKILELCSREAQQVFGGLGMNKEGPGRIVEQISRDMRVFVVGGGSEEILDDLGMRIVLSASSRMKGRL